MSIRLYIVEHIDHVRAMLVDILRLHGFEVVGSARTGEQAVAESDAADPDVVVLGLKLPGIDGLEVARRIGELRPGQQLILYSAYIDAEVERQAKDAGIAACVPKLAGVEALAREISAVAVDLGG